MSPCLCWASGKHRKYDAPVATMNPPLRFVAIAFSGFGGIGLEFYATAVRPYFDELRENEEAPGADPEIPNSRSPDSRFCRETGRESPIPGSAGIGKEGIPDSRFGRERESGPRADWPQT